MNVTGLHELRCANYVRKATSKSGLKLIQIVYCVFGSRTSDTNMLAAFLGVCKTVHCCYSVFATPANNKHNTFDVFSELTRTTRQQRVVDTILACSQSAHVAFGAVLVDTTCDIPIFIMRGQSDSPNALAAIALHW